MSIINKYILKENIFSEVDTVELENVLDDYQPTNKLGRYTVEEQSIFNNLFDHDNRLSSAQHPYGRDILIYVNPKDFLDLSSGASYNIDPVFYLNKILNRELIHDVPFWIINDDDDMGSLYITGHEGRHRAKAFMFITEIYDQYRDHKMPVRINHPYFRWRQHEEKIPDRMVLRGQDNRDRIVIRKEDIQELR